jgi:predicted Zn-dependent protease with MMP-like domain
MTLDEFADLVATTLESLPKELKDKLDNLIVDVEEEPDRVTLAKSGIPIGHTLGGVCIKCPGLPCRIIIYKSPIEANNNPSELCSAVRRVVIHELSHYLGFDEKRSREYERG